MWTPGEGAGLPSAASEPLGEIVVNRKLGATVMAPLAAAAVILALSTSAAYSARSGVTPDGVPAPVNVTASVTDASDITFSDEELKFQGERAEAAGTTAERVQADDVRALQLGQIAAQLESGYEGLFVQSAWRQDHTPQAQLVLTGGVPAGAWEIIKSAPFEIDVVDTDGPTLNESTTALDQIIQGLRASGDVSLVTGDYDPIASVYSVSYFGERLDESAAMRTARAVTSEEVEITYVGALSEGEGPQLFGGDPIHVAGSTAGSVVWAGPLPAP
ncbi:hypothetical protein NY547_09200 [Cnuibacter physcomitrellae]|uniref:hypothetical protein n=1 Tax=Cnuibacter physcomitrellae TaxID=1619308 RepID=UPI002175B9D5|nr:hypothetical protein [Cnuibacter physcomitrellae]MCS5497411.1 hypothetical protein [Cnuibacter physcomitrellae]